MSSSNVEQSDITSQQRKLLTVKTPHEAPPQIMAEQRKSKAREPPHNRTRRARTAPSLANRGRTRWTSLAPIENQKTRKCGLDNAGEMRDSLRYLAATMEVRQYYRQCLQSITRRIADENELILSRLRAGRAADGDRTKHDEFVSALTEKWASAGLMPKRYAYLKDWSDQSK